MPQVLRQFKALQAALKIDQVLSLAQVEHHFQLSARHLGPPLHLRSVTLATIAKSVSSTRHVTFVMRDAELANRLSEDQLAHLAGAAELRLQLDAPLHAKEWESTASAIGAGHTPDAVRHLPEGSTIAIEYDAGSYVTRKVWRKLRAFTQDPAYAGVVYGVASEQRARRLAATLMDPSEALVAGIHRGRVIFMHAPWWAPVQTPLTLQLNQAIRLGKAARDVPPQPPSTQTASSGRVDASRSDAG